MIRSALPEETEQLVNIGESTGIFEEGEVDELLRQTLLNLHAGKLGPSHAALVYLDWDVPVGWCYFSASSEDDLQSWILWFIGISPDSQASGIGTKLLTAVEEKCKAGANGRPFSLSVDTSAKFIGAQKFYEKNRFIKSEVKKDLYGPGKDQITYIKKFD